MRWICADCREPREEQPAIEYQHLFPGCGSSCGYYSRVCMRCVTARLMTYTRFATGEFCESARVVFLADHERYHATHRPSSDGAPQIHVKKKAEEKT